MARFQLLPGNAAYFDSRGCFSSASALSPRNLLFRRQLSSTAEAAPKVASAIEYKLLPHNKQLQNDIDLKIRQLCYKRCIPPGEFKSFIEDDLSACSVSHIADIMRFTGQKMKKTNYLLIRNHLPAISSRITELLSNDWDHKNIASVMCGLSGLDESDGVTEIISMMTELVTRTIENEDTILLLCIEAIPWKSNEAKEYISVVTKAISKRGLIANSEHIGHAIYALQKINCDSDEVRSLLSMLGKILSNCHVMDVQSVRKAFYGMRYMNSDNPEVLAILSALTSKIENCKEFNSTYDISDALMGLRRVSCDSLEVRTLIKCLAIKLQNCNFVSEPRAVSKSLSGLQRMKSSNHEVRMLLSVLVERVKECKIPLDSLQISSAMYGLQSLNSDEEEVRAVLTSLTTIILNCKEYFSAEEIGTSLYGLQGMTSDSDQTLFLLSSLVHQIFYCKENLTSNDIGNSIFGLQGMSCEKSEVRALIAVLTTLLQRSIVTLQSRDMGKTLFGLQRMSGDSNEMRIFLSSLTLRLETCTDVRATDLSNALYGLQRMRNNSDCVHELVCALAAKLMECNDVFTNEMISNALYGLQGMTSGDSDLDLLLPLLTKKIKDSKDDFTIQDVGNSLYGLQSMNSDCPHVIALIQVLTTKIRYCEDDFTVFTLGNALYGLQGVLVIPETNLILRLLYKQSKKLYNRTSQFTLIETKEFIRFGQSVLLILPFLREEPSVKYIFNKLEKISDHLMNELDERKSKNTLSEIIPSVQELKMQKLVKNSLSNSNFSITFNEYAVDFFDVDIVLRNNDESEDESNKSMICIFIDEFDYNVEKTERFLSLRDEYFLSNGIIFDHIKADLLYDMTEKELKIWFEKKRSKNSSS